MRKSLLVIERIVLESLEGRSRSINELLEQTSLNEPLLKAVLHQLLERGIIRYQSMTYELNWENKSRWLPLVQDQSGTKAEVKELLSSMVNKSFENRDRTSMKLKKIWLAPLELEEFERKIKDIDFFIDSIQEKRKTKPVKEYTCKKKVIVYGACGYQDLVDDLLCAS